MVKLIEVYSPTRKKKVNINTFVYGKNLDDKTSRASIDLKNTRVKYSTRND
jgi:hypothetical protein